MNQALAQQAESLLALFIKKTEEIFSKRITAIFKLGSLGNHGDFSLCSDVDVALFLDHIEASDYEKVQRLWDEVKASPLPYADRLSVFWSSYTGGSFQKGEGRFPALDRLDLIEHAILLKGTDERANLPCPTQQDLIRESAAFISSFMLAGKKREQLVNHQEKIPQAGARYFTKFVLFPVRLIFTLDYPMTIGSNKDAVEHFETRYKKEFPEVAKLVRFAYTQRNTPSNQPVEVETAFLKATLPVLYDYCIKRYDEAVKILA